MGMTTGIKKRKNRKSEDSTIICSDIQRRSFCSLKDRDVFLRTATASKRDCSVRTTGLDSVLLATAVSI